MHAGIDQHENRDDHAVLVLFEKIQSQIDQRQEDEVGEETVGIAQKQHEDAPGGLGRVELPASAQQWRSRQESAAGGPVQFTRMAQPWGQQPAPVTKDSRAVALRTREQPAKQIASNRKRNFQMHRKLPVMQDISGCNQ
jgi:hypothetical protein